MKKQSFGYMSWVLLTFLLATDAQSEDAKSPAQLTLCEVLNSPSKYDGKLVSFRAAVQPIDTEDLLISDQSCTSSGAIVALAFNAQHDSERANLVNAFVEAMNRSKIGKPCLAYADLTVMFRTTLHGQKLPGKVFEIRAAKNVHFIERGSQ
jgi:hypothetical protein